MKLNFLSDYYKIHTKEEYPQITSCSRDPSTNSEIINPILKQSDLLKSNVVKSEFVVSKLVVGSGEQGIQFICLFSAAQQPRPTVREHLYMTSDFWVGR